MSVLHNRLGQAVRALLLRQVFPAVLWDQVDLRGSCSAVLRSCTLRTLGLAKEGMVPLVEMLVGMRGEVMRLAPLHIAVGLMGWRSLKVPMRVTVLHHQQVCNRHFLLPRETVLRPLVGHNQLDGEFSALAAPPTRPPSSSAMHRWQCL